MLFWDTLYKCRGSQLYCTILHVFSERCFSPEIVEKYRDNLLVLMPKYHKYMSTTTLTQKTFKYIADEALKMDGVVKCKSDSEDTMIFEAAFLVLLHFKQDVRDKLCLDFDALKELYPEFVNNRDVDEVELMKLLLYRNMMVVALQVIPAKFKKTHLLDLVVRLSEGNKRKYCCGGGQSESVDRRVLIYEREGGIVKMPRAPRWNEIVSSLFTVLSTSGDAANATESNAPETTAQESIDLDNIQQPIGEFDVEELTMSQANNCNIIEPRKENLRRHLSHVSSGSSVDSRNQPIARAPKIKKINSTSKNEVIHLPNKNGNVQIVHNEVIDMDTKLKVHTSSISHQPESPLVNRNGSYSNASINNFGEYDVPSMDYISIGRHGGANNTNVQGQEPMELINGTLHPVNSIASSHTHANIPNAYNHTSSNTNGDDEFVEVLQHVMITDVEGKNLFENPMDLDFITSPIMSASVSSDSAPDSKVLDISSSEETYTNGGSLVPLPPQDTMDMIEALVECGVLEESDEVTVNTASSKKSKTKKADTTNISANRVASNTMINIEYTNSSIAISKQSTRLRNYSNPPPPLGSYSHGASTNSLPMSLPISAGPSTESNSNRTRSNTGGGMNNYFSNQNNESKLTDYDPEGDGLNTAAIKSNSDTSNYSLLSGLESRTEDGGGVGGDNLIQSPSSAGMTDLMHFYGVNGDGKHTTAATIGQLFDESNERTQQLYGSYTGISSRGGIGRGSVVLADQLEGECEVSGRHDRQDSNSKSSHTESSLASLFRFGGKGSNNSDNDSVEMETSSTGSNHKDRHAISMILGSRNSNSGGNSSYNVTNGERSQPSTTDDKSEASSITVSRQASSIGLGSSCVTYDSLCKQFSVDCQNGLLSRKGTMNSVSNCSNDSECAVSTVQSPINVSNANTSNSNITTNSQYELLSYNNILEEIEIDTKNSSLSCITTSTSLISDFFYSEIQDSVFVNVDTEPSKERSKKKEKTAVKKEKDSGNSKSLGLGIGIADMTPTAIWRKLNGTSNANTSSNSNANNSSILVEDHSRNSISAVKNNSEVHDNHANPSVDTNRIAGSSFTG